MLFRITNFLFDFSLAVLATLLSPVTLTCFIFTNGPRRGIGGTRKHLVRAWTAPFENWRYHG